MTPTATDGLATLAMPFAKAHFRGKVIIDVIEMSALAGSCPGKPGSRASGTL
jgi:hypothetical protein